MSLFRSIKQKWNEGHQSQGGYFIQHINGNTLDNRRENLTLIHPYDAFSHPEWKVDWVCDLTKREIKFVMEHLEAFKNSYKESRIQMNNFIHENPDKFVSTHMITV